MRTGKYIPRKIYFILWKNEKPAADSAERETRQVKKSGDLVEIQ